MPLSDAEFQERAKRIRLIICDADGVLTDGSIVYDEMGCEVKRFHVRDGFGVRSWIRVGGQIACITGRWSQPLALRCRELGIRPVIQKSPDKRSAFREVLDRCGRVPDEVCVIGDDLPDLPMILSAGLGVAVADADPHFAESADWVTNAAGGHGAVREVIVKLLKSQDRWKDVIDHYRREITDLAG